jgi:signal transduction histidine kinase
LFRAWTATAFRLEGDFLHPLAVRGGLAGSGEAVQYRQPQRVSRLLSLINDILDLSKIEAGRMELGLADFHLPAAIDDALLLMRERASRRGLALERHVDERLGEFRADQRKVKQALLNLLSNAVKFTPEGGRIDVRAALVDGVVEISVTDTGIGIAPEDQEAVFEEFRQVGKADKKAEGTGRGLALCRKFVELHGGRIGVKSEFGQGSTFTLPPPAAVATSPSPGDAEGDARGATYIRK